MDDDVVNRLRGTGQTDQVVAATQNLARMTASYYTALVAGGVPPFDAHHLVRDWHWMLLRHEFWPDDPVEQWRADAP